MVMLLVPMPTNLEVVVVCSRPNFLMVVDRVLVPVVLEVEELLLLLLLSLLVLSVLQVLLVQVCICLEAGYDLDLLHVCTLDMTINFL